MVVLSCSEVAGNIVVKLGYSSKRVSIREIGAFFEQALKIPEVREAVLKKVAAWVLENDANYRDYLRAVVSKALEDPRTNDELVHMLSANGFKYVQVPVEVVKDE